ncbi:F-box/LRR-repeat protein 2 isoform X2 [Nematostella vectensis]|nr:F-box/LRR-repeat protein 2 isoform X2 [Nematostella vectensis]
MKCLEQITNASIVTMVKNCTNICEIKISRCYKVSDGAVQAITDTLETKLEILNLNNQRLITDLSLMALGACPNLKELNINGCNITTGNGLQMVTTSCPKLSCLDIGYCYRACRNGPCFITAEFLPASLTELTLHGIQLPGDLITKLAQRLSKIKILRLCGIQAVDDTVLEEVCSTAGGTLVELDLSACSAITDDGLSAIPRHCYVIESLILSFCSKVTGRRLFPLLEDPKRAAEIRVMIANGCKAFSIDVIRKLAMSCPNLETLLLAGLKEMDDEMVSIVARQCPKLQAINLKGCELVTDAGVSELARLCPLAHVVVSGIHSLTDKSVFALTNGCASTLKVVYASACTKMTTQAINYLKDCCLRRVFVEHRTPNLEPGQLMALNLDTGEYCRADLLFPQAPHT